jgi:hypothetical protein
VKSYIERGQSCTRRNWLRLLFLCACLSAIFVPSIHAQRDERAVRAAYVYHLTQYVSWPNSHSDLTICSLGEKKNTSTLQQVLNNKSADNRKLHVVLNPSEQELQHCDILYIADSSRSHVRSILDKARSRGILSVGDDDAFMQAGGMVGLVRSGDQIIIKVNLDEVRAGGLRISSRLLDLAVIVHTKKGG